MGEAVHYGDCLTINLDDTTFTLTLKNDLLIADSSSIDTSIFSLEKYTRWKYLLVRVFPSVTFGVQNILSPWKIEYFQYSPDKGLTKVTGQRYRELKETMYRMATKTPQEVKLRKPKVVESDSETLKS